MAFAGNATAELRERYAGARSRQRRKHEVMIAYQPEILAYATSESAANENIGAMPSIGKFRKLAMPPEIDATRMNKPGSRSDLACIQLQDEVKRLGHTLVKRSTSGVAHGSF